MTELKGNVIMDIMSERLKQINTINMANWKGIIANTDNVFYGPGTVIHEHRHNQETQEIDESLNCSEDEIGRRIAPIDGDPCAGSLMDLDEKELLISSKRHGLTVLRLGLKPLVKRLVGIHAVLDLSVPTFKANFVRKDIITGEEKPLESFEYGLEMDSLEYHNFADSSKYRVKDPYQRLAALTIKRRDPDFVMSPVAQTLREPLISRFMPVGEPLEKSIAEVLA